MRTYKYVQLIAALLPVVTTSANLKKTNYSVQLIARSLFVEVQCVICPKTLSLVQKIAKQAIAEMAFANRMKIQHFVLIAAMELLHSVQIAFVTSVKRFCPVQVIVVPEHVEIESVKLMNILDSVRKIVLPIPSAAMAFAIPTKTQKSVQRIARSSLAVMAFASWMNRSVSVLLIASPLLMVAEIMSLTLIK